MEPVAMQLEIGSLSRGQRGKGRLLFGQIGVLDPEDGEIGAVKPAQVAPRAILRPGQHRVMVALGVEVFRELQAMGGTKVDAEGTPFAGPRFNEDPASALL